MASGGTKDIIQGSKLNPDPITGKFTARNPNLIAQEGINPWKLPKDIVTPRGSPAESDGSISESELRIEASNLKVAQGRLQTEQIRVRESNEEVIRQAALNQQKAKEINAELERLKAKEQTMEAEFQKKMKDFTDMVNKLAREKDTADHLMKQYQHQKYEEESTSHKKVDQASHHSREKDPRKERTRTPSRDSDRSRSRERRSPPRRPKPQRSPTRSASRDHSHERSDRIERDEHEDDTHYHSNPEDRNHIAARPDDRRREPIHFRDLDFGPEVHDEIAATATQPIFHSPEESHLVAQQEAIKLERRALQSLRIQIDHKRQKLRRDPHSTSTARLTDLENSYLERKRAMFTKEEQLNTAKTIAAKYEVSLDMPIINRRYVRRPTNAMEVRTITSAIHAYDPVTHPDRDFSQVWERVLVYGEPLNLTEAEYIQILTNVVHGPKLTTLRKMQAKHSSLQEILDHFAVSACKQITIVDHQADVDNFTRIKGETLKQAMNRAENAVDKLDVLHEPLYWPAMKDNKLRIILNQILTPDTKEELITMESNINRLGGKTTLRSLIDHLHHYEVTRNKIPKKDIATTFQVASLNLKPSVQHQKTESQLQAFKQGQVTSSKTLENKLEQFIQVASAHYAQRGRSLEKMSAKKPFGSSTSTHRKSSASPLPDTDSKMDDLSQQVQQHDAKTDWKSQPSDNKHRADKKDHEKRNSESYNSDHRSRSGSRNYQTSNSRNNSGSRDQQSKNDHHRSSSSNNYESLKQALQQLMPQDSNVRQFRDRSSSQDRRNGRSNTPGRDLNHRSQNGTERGSRPSSRERSFIAPMTSLAIAVMDNAGMQCCIPCNVFFIKNTVCPNSHNHSKN